MKNEDGFSKVFSLITAACLGLSELDSIKESFSVESLKKLKYNNGRHYYARASVDEGTIDAKMDSDFRYFSLCQSRKTVMQNISIILMSFQKHFLCSRIRIF